MRREKKLTARKRNFYIGLVLLILLNIIIVVTGLYIIYRAL